MNTRQTKALGTENIQKLLFRLAAPAIAAQIINLLYNLVDRMYIGHIPTVGKLALTGVGLCFPLIILISAFAMLVAMGSASKASISLGKGENDIAEQILGNSTTLLIIISLILTLIIQFFAKDMLLLFGASQNTIDYATDYVVLYSYGTIFVQLTIGLNAFISAQGFAKTSMLTVLIGAILNIILDPIFIFGMNMGVRGAALATVISQASSTLWILYFLTGKKTTIRLKPNCMKLSTKIWLPCIALGLSPFVMQFTESILAICFNESLLKYGGDLAVGAMTILTSCSQLSILPLLGLSQGAQPIISYNFGASKSDRVRQAFNLLLKYSLTFSLILWGLIELFPQFFVLIFNNDPELLTFTSRALRIYSAVFGIFGIQIACQHAFIALGDAKSSLAAALLRKVIILIPLIYIFPNLSIFPDKTTAVFIAEPVADFIAVVFTATLFYFRFKKAMSSIENPPHKITTSIGMYDPKS